MLEFVLQTFSYLVDCIGIWSKIVIFLQKFQAGHCNFLAVNFSASRIAAVPLQIPLQEAPIIALTWMMMTDDDNDDDDKDTD